MIFITKAWHSRGQRFDPAYLHQKCWKPMVFNTFFISSYFFARDYRPLEYSANLSLSRGVVMARISMRNVQKSPVSEYFDLFLSSVAARGVKDKTLSTYKQHLMELRMLSASDFISSIIASYLFSSSILASSSILDIVVISFIFVVAVSPCCRGSFVFERTYNRPCWNWLSLITRILYHKRYEMSIDDCTKFGTYYLHTFWYNSCWQTTWNTVYFMVQRRRYYACILRQTLWANDPKGYQKNRPSQYLQD